MSNDKKWTFLHNQLNDLKKLVARLQREIIIMKRLIGLGIGIGVTGLAVGVYVLARQIGDRL